MRSSGILGKSFAVATRVSCVRKTAEDQVQSRKAAVIAAEALCRQDIIDTIKESAPGFDASKVDSNIFQKIAKASDEPDIFSQDAVERTLGDLLWQVSRYDHEYSSALETIIKSNTQNETFELDDISALGPVPAKPFGWRIDESRIVPDMNKKDFFPVLITGTEATRYLLEIAGIREFPAAPCEDLRDKLSGTAGFSLNSAEALFCDWQQAERVRKTVSLVLGGHFSFLPEMSFGIGAKNITKMVAEQCKGIFDLVPSIFCLITEKPDEMGRPHIMYADGSFKNADGTGENPAAGILLNRKQW